MRLCIADPPYLGRAHRYYGVGGTGIAYGAGRADEHDGAREWDDPTRHVQLVRDLDAEFDAWAIAMTVHSIGVYASAVDLDSRSGYRFGAWIKPRAVPSGSRITTAWEPVLFHIPIKRRGRVGVNCLDWVSAQTPASGFMGAKPAAWTRWVLDVLGYDPENDELIDLFPGSGAVQAWAAQGVLI